MQYNILLLMLLLSFKTTYSQLIIPNCVTKESVYDYKFSGNGEVFKIGIDSINRLYLKINKKTEKDRTTSKVYYYDAFFNVIVDSVGNAITVKPLDKGINNPNNNIDELKLFILSVFPTNKVYRYDSRDGSVIQILEFELYVMYNENNFYKIKLSSLPTGPDKQ